MHRGETLSSRQALEALDRTLPNTMNWVVSCFPRGSTQVVQPAKVSPLRLKAYEAEYHADDRATWETLKHGKALTDQEIWHDVGGIEQSRYYREFLQPAGLRYVLTTPVNCPIFPGYPGTWHVFRTPDQGPFSSAEVQQFVRLARSYDQAVEVGRQTRQGRPSAQFVGAKRPQYRQFIFNREANLVYNQAGWGVLDERLREQMLQHIHQSLGRVSDQGIWNDRLCLPDSRGDLWVFRVVAYREFSALGEGPFVIYSIQPDYKDWSAVRAADLQADPEVARLVPALQFMCREFGRGPTLNEIAATVRLSPFHFHRRFTELFGITPKHLLLECQIHSAKQHMVAGDKDLVEIANACGFAHQSHFTSRFKQATGLTPTGWRRMADEIRSGR